MKKFLIGFVILIVLIFLYGRYVEPNTIRVKEYTLASSKITENINGFKIAHFSDLLYNERTTTKYLEKIVNKINETKPDIIIFTGDLIDKDYKISAEEQKALIKILNKLECSLYKYAIIGDNDKKNLDQYHNILEAIDFKLLNNAREYVFYKDINPLKILGLTDSADIASIMVDEENITPLYTIALSHYPDDIEKITDNNNIDLILSGHALGGVVRVPFIGPLIKKDGAKKYLDSHYKLNNSEVYTANGIGNESFNFRLFNIPTINLYRLVQK